MYKLITRGVFAPPPSIRKLGFGVAAFTCAPVGDGKTPRFPANSSPRVLTHGRKS